MQEYEVKAYLEYIPYLDRNSWEQLRYDMFSNIQMNTSKPINAQDLLKFPWDEIVDADTDISNNDIERLRNKSKLIQEKYYNNLEQVNKG